MSDLRAIMVGVREYSEERAVTLEDCEGRLVVTALNEGGHCATSVDLLDLLTWVRANRPELLVDIAEGQP